MTTDKVEAASTKTIASLGIKFGCGCGFQTTHVEEAMTHCADSRHQLDIRGSVKPVVIK